MNNQMELKFKSLPENESFARACVAAFCVQLDPTIEELGDIKTAVSEAVTNCVVHAYPDKVGDISIKVHIQNNKVSILVSDFGMGISDIEQAKTPFFTTKPEQERSGMGFTVMEGFVDQMQVRNNKNGGLSVKLIKNIQNAKLSSVG